MSKGARRYSVTRILFSGHPSRWLATAASDMRSDMKRIVFGMGLALLAAPAVAADPTALVEDVSATAAGVEFMDYVEAGRVIHLGTGGTLVQIGREACRKRGCKSV